MSMFSELKKRAGSRVRVRAAPSRRSSSAGPRMNLILSRARDRTVGDVFEVARQLVRLGIPLRSAKRAVDELVEGKLSYVEAPAVANYTLLKRRLSRQSVEARHIRLHAVNVKDLRARLGISQEAFAGRYGLDVATVRNWEQGRTKPEGPAAALLLLIERDPDKVVDLLAR
jgi:DNA-binding transcriptional regulator YiaG